MAVVGVTIGISFSLAMVLSTVIAEYFGLSGIFYLTALLAFTALVFAGIALFLSLCKRLIKKIIQKMIKHFHVLKR